MKFGACADCGIDVTWTTSPRERCRPCAKARARSMTAEWGRSHVYRKREPGYVPEYKKPLAERAGYAARLKSLRATVRHPADVEGDGYEYDVGRFIVHARWNKGEGLIFDESGRRRPDKIGRATGPFVEPRDGESLRFDY